MRIVSVDESAATLTVERGVDDTNVVSHHENLPIFITKPVTLTEFFTGTQWNPQLGRLGIWPLLNATLMTTFFALLLALPVGLGVAIYLSEYATARFRSLVKPVLEILVGVPTVVYGYFALTWLTPLLQDLLGVQVKQFNALSAGLVMGIMIVPTIASISEDALSSVPGSLRQASYALGATRFETTYRVVLPAAISGIMAAFLLGISRAVGETMIVALAAGAGQSYPPDWAERTIFDLRLPTTVERAKRDETARADIALLLEQNLNSARLLQLVYSDIVQFELLRSWNLIESLTQRGRIQRIAAEEYPNAHLEFYSWINGDFLSTPISNQALTTGIRVAILGSLWMLLIAISVSLPLGVGAAIYWEEYARDGRHGRLLRTVNNFIETNIRNLAGVPSIIYGMLGLAVFVRALEHITSGGFMGMTDSDGRTILSAGMTMALLI